MRKLLLKLLRDESGEFDWMWGDSSIKEAVLGKGEEIYDPYAELREKYKTYLGDKLGTSTPYKYNDAFTIDQPEVEKAAESTILGKLNSGVSNVSDYSEATKKYSDAMKASRNETYADEAKKTSDMYNRLGLVSSTPGLQAQSDLSRKQSTESNLFDSELAYKNLDRTLTAQGLDVTELNNILGQAQNMGKTQRSNQQYSQQASENDISRMTSEEQGYANMLGSLLGGQQPEQSYDAGILGQLTKSGSELLPYLLMMGLV